MSQSSRKGPVAYPSAQSYCEVNDRAAREQAHARKCMASLRRRRQRQVPAGQDDRSTGISERDSTAADDSVKSQPSTSGRPKSPMSAKVERIMRYQRRDWSWEERPAYERRIADVMVESKELEGKVSADLQTVKDIELAVELFGRMHDEADSHGEGMREDCLSDEADPQDDNDYRHDEIASAAPRRSVDGSISSHASSETRTPRGVVCSMIAQEAMALAECLALKNSLRDKLAEYESERGLNLEGDPGKASEGCTEVDMPQPSLTKRRSVSVRQRQQDQRLAPVAEGVGGSLSLQRGRRATPLPRVATLPRVKPPTPPLAKRGASRKFNPDNLYSVQRHAQFIAEQTAKAQERDIREAKQRGFKARPVPKSVTAPPIPPLEERRRKMMKKLAARGVEEDSHEAKLASVMAMDKEGVDLLERLLEDPLADVARTLSKLAVDDSESDGSASTSGSDSGNGVGDTKEDEQDRLSHSLIPSITPGASEQAVAGLLSRQREWEVARQRRRSELESKLQAEAEAVLKPSRHLPDPEEGMERWRKAKAEHRLSLLREQQATVEREQQRQAAEQRRQSSVKEEILVLAAQVEARKRHSKSKVSRQRQKKRPDHDRAATPKGAIPKPKASIQDDDDFYAQAVAAVMERTQRQGEPRSQIVFLPGSAEDKEEGDSASASSEPDEPDVTQAGPCPESRSYLAQTGLGSVGAADPAAEDSVLFGSWEGMADSKLVESAAVDFHSLPPYERWEMGGCDPAQFFDPITSTPDKGRFRVADARHFVPESLHRDRDAKIGVTLLLGRREDGGQEQLITIMFDRGCFNEAEAASWWKRSMERFRDSGHIH